MRKLSLVTLLLGMALLIWLLKQIGVEQLWENAKGLGWSFWVLIPLALVWILPNTKGLALAFHPSHTPLPFRKLVVARLVGESVNYVTPSGYLGGEPVKAALMASQLGMGNAMSAVVVAKTTQTLALFIFIVLGLSLANIRFSLSPAAKVAAIAAVLLLGIGVLLMVLGSAKTLATRMTHKGGDYFKKFSWFHKFQDFIVTMDHSLSGFYREHKTRFVASTLWHLAGWAMGTVEVLVLVYLLGHSISVVDAFLLSSVANLFMVGGLFIPGSLGAFELGHYVASAMVGLPLDVGVSISLARRFREVIWFGIGLILFGIFRKTLLPKKQAVQPA